MQGMPSFYYRYQRQNDYDRKKIIPIVLQIPINAWGNGMYFVQINNGVDKVNKKIVAQRQKYTIVETHICAPLLCWHQRLFVNIDIYIHHRQHQRQHLY